MKLVYSNRKNSFRSDAFFLSLLIFFQSISPAFAFGNNRFNNLQSTHRKFDKKSNLSNVSIALSKPYLNTELASPKKESETFIKSKSTATPKTTFLNPGGPDQPEVHGFTSSDNDNLVDLFTGDFSYSIPLLEVDGYPINLGYSAGIGMEQEASWVGLGWNLNPGVINRNMRGIPDDFNGSDKVVQEFNQADNWTAGTSVGANFELFSIDLSDITPGDNGGLSISAQLGIQYNNYNGFGADFSAGPSFGIAKKTGFDVGIQYSGSSQNGASVGTNIGLSQGSKSGDWGGKLSIGSSFNSRSGLQSLSVNYSASVNVSKESEKVNDNHKDIGNQEYGIGSVGSSFSFGTSTFVPNIPFSTKASSFTARFKLGGDIIGSDASVEFSGFFSKSKLAYNSRIISAYGYMYSGSGQSNQDAMLDFNRENDAAFTKNTPALPIPFLTYDTYSVSGNGISGSYRMDRTDMGYVFDPQITSTSTSFTLGGEVNFGLTFKAGVDIGASYTAGRSGVWTENNEGIKSLRFNNSIPYFREANDLAYDEGQTQFTNMGGSNPISFQLKSYNSSSSNLNGAPNFENSKSTSFRRNQPLTPLLLWQVKDGFGYTPLPSSSYAATNSDINEQIGAFTVTKTDGSIYYYGVPAYSKAQKNVSFAVGESETGSGLTPNYSTRLVTYSGTDATIDNKRGLDHYYNAQNIPAFTHSYLLSAVLSADYVDSDNEPGPSKGDLGNYINFKYKQVPTYKWRNPVNANQAFYDAGLNANPNDDKAHYIYGEKELWYLDTIQTKNHIVIFYKSNRDDAVSVNGETGGLSGGNARMLKLDSIKLYSRPDYEQNGGNAIPIKTVHFVYDYSLCGNYTGHLNNTGKLTLTKLYFSYENSYEGERTPYQFEYGYNPNYNPNDVDRWGSFKPNPSGLTGNELTDPLTNGEFPYVGYDTTNTNKWASAWDLSKIYLPTGGRVEVDYESDDYAFVQHKRAKQMFKIIGVEGCSSANCSISEASHENRKIYFEMIPGTNVQDYGQVGDVVYFRALLSMNKSLSDYDYVPGYAKILEIGLESGMGYLKLEPGKLKDNGSADYNPMAIAGVQFARNYLSRYIPPSSQSGSQQDGDSFLNIVKALIGAFTSFGELFTGPNKPLWSDGIGTYLVVNKSWVRLNNPNYAKLGGGHRVKEIRTYDAWNSMTTSGTESFYGKQYQYKFDGKSSGVAAYEPQLGGEENVWRTFLANDIKLTLAPDMRNYMETPFGESFFPSPIVGYSKVRVSNIERAGVDKTATGYTINEFYTAQDFPTITGRTALSSMPRKKSKNLLLFSSSEDMIAASQGFVVESNDMHGKPKKVEIYAEKQVMPYSTVSYYYQSDPVVLESIAANKLSNDVKVITPNGTIKNVTVGRTYELVGDFRENKTNMYSGNMGINLNYTMPFILLPMILGANFAKSKTEFRSAVVSKTIERKGILHKIVARDYNSIIETENLAYDSETGAVLLTSVNNGFNDTVYNFTYPAHWIYDQMGQAAKNVGYESGASASFVNGYTTSYPASIFIEGDEVIFYQSGNYVRGWVTEKGGDAIRILMKYGAPVTGNVSYLKIIRSGNRNMQSTPVGSIALMNNPLNTLSGNVFDKVLQTGSIEYGQNWKTFCECDASTNTNPYTRGLKGNWKPKASYLYLSGRYQTFENKNTNIRKDGTMESYLPFFRLRNGSWSLNKENWTFTSEVTDFSPFGAPIETVDALGRFSATQIGYNQTMQVAVSTNAMHRQIGFDGFEDYDFLNCPDNHFHVAAINEVDANNSHTGKHSLHVLSGYPVVFQKQIAEMCDSTHCTISYQETSDSLNYSLIFSNYIPGLSVEYEVVYGDVSLDVIEQGQSTTYSFDSSNSYKIKITITDGTGCSEILIKEIN